MRKITRKNKKVIEAYTDSTNDYDNNDNIEGDDMDQIVTYEEGKEVIDIQDESNKSTKSKNTGDSTPENDIIYINRNEEDKDVIKFQETGDLSILEKVYKNRIPTLRTWTYQHYYPGLVPSVEDLFAELTIVFIKAANKYEKERGAFNTCLFTFLLNRIKNLKNSKYAKKRISDEYDGPLSGMVLSLDYTYNDDGNQITLKDVLANKESIDAESIHQGTNLLEAVQILSKGDDLMKEFFVKLSEGNSVAGLIKEYKTRQGTIKISNRRIKNLGKSKAKIKTLVASSIHTNHFTLLDYACGDNEISYTVELKKTHESDRIMRSLRELKKNKTAYLRHIRGKE